MTPRPLFAFVCRLMSLGALSAFSSACASEPARIETLPHAALTTNGSASSRLVDLEGAPFDLGALVARSNLTVIEFFSAHCPCQLAHDERLNALALRYAPRGVAFVAVSSEGSLSVDEARVVATQRAYAFPVLIDRGGAFADAVGAEYATYTLIVDRSGRVRYRGGIDSDRTHLQREAAPYVAWALDDLLAGRPPRRPEAEVLGCALEKS